MKIKEYGSSTLIGLFSICISSSFAQRVGMPATSVKSDTLYVQENKGLKGIYFDIATIEDVQNIMGKGTIVKPGEAGTSATSNITRLEYHGGYLNNGHGLEFEFKPNAGGKLILSEICIGDSMKAKTGNGVILNKSTKQDIVMNYGPPTMKDFFSYPQASLSFGVNNEGVVYRIIVLKPLIAHK